MSTNTKSSPRLAANNIAITCLADIEDSQRKLHDAPFNGYLKDGSVGDIHFNRSPVFESESQGGYYYLVKSGRVFSIDCYRLQQNKSFDDIHSVGVIVPTAKRVGTTAGYANIVLMNGDEDSNDLVGNIACNDMPTISFDCLAHFYPKQSQKTIEESLVKGILWVIDWTPDKEIELTTEEKKALRANNAIGNDSTKKPIAMPAPVAGYTLVNSDNSMYTKWHCAATILIRDTRKNGPSILVGQDENMYFGVELADHPTSVTAAFTSLMPKDIRDQTGVRRQGEWFIVPRDAKDVPSLLKVIGTFSSTVASEDDDGENSSFYLPLESDDSNKHFLVTNEGRIGADGVIYARDFELFHSAGEHEEVTHKGWASFHRNTAKRSFSIQGVD